MGYFVLVLLSLLWLGFFLPGLLQARRSSPYVSATDFKESLQRISAGLAVEPITPAPRVRRSRREIARRRDTLLGLVAATIGGVAMGLSFGGALWLLAVPPTVALVFYVIMLRIAATKRHGRMARRVVYAANGPGASPPTTAVVDKNDLERLAG
ncbi:MAG: hypothetical protein GEU74_03610 [Nitriliruptorales bacterium]|nr:hypothetical protein [Nitriliruptorales bacterium]